VKPEPGEPEKAVLRIFLDTFQKWHHRPVYEVVVERARDSRLAGATVLAALEGFGQAGRLHVNKPWRLGSDREVVVEVVDSPQRIEAFLTEIEPVLGDAVVTLKRARTLVFHSEREASS
jgi:PII-like signaling protein